MMEFKRRKVGVVLQLPKEIIEEILLRLPIETLVKLTAVCKSWKSLIKTSAFIHAQLSRNQNQILLIQAAVGLGRRGKKKIRDLYSLHWDNPPFNLYSNYKFMNNPFVVYNRSHAISPKDKINLDPQRGCVYVIGTCNGLVCLVASSDDGTALIWNPCIRKYLMLPRLTPNISRREINSITYGFGYDSLTDDYKVLRIVNTTKEGLKTYEIWSLAQPFWKNLSAPHLPADDFQPHSRAVFVSGAVHWVNACKFKAHSIVSFNMSSELFGEMMIPEALKKENDIFLRYKDSLAFFQWPEFVKGKPLDMWVMKEYGVVESWSKLLTFQVGAPWIQLCGFRNSGEAVINYTEWKRDQLNPRNNGIGESYKLLNPMTNGIGDFQINGCSRFFFRFVEPFIESLVLLDQPCAISSCKLK